MQGAPLHRRKLSKREAHSTSAESCENRAIEDRCWSTIRESELESNREGFPGRKNDHAEVHDSSKVDVSLGLSLAIGQEHLRLRCQVEDSTSSTLCC